MDDDCLLTLHTTSVVPTFSWRMRCNWALIMRRPASQLYVSIAAFDVATRHTRSAGCKCCNMLVSQREDVADSLNDAVLKLFLIRLLTTFIALSSVRDGSQSAVGGCMWESENIYPSIVGVFETALPCQWTVLSHDHISSRRLGLALGCLLPMRTQIIYGVFFNKDHTLQGPKQRCSNLLQLLKGN